MFDIKIYVNLQQIEREKEFSIFYLKPKVYLYFTQTKYSLTMHFKFRSLVNMHAFIIEINRDYGYINSFFK